MVTRSVQPDGSHLVIGDGTSENIFGDTPVDTPSGPHFSDDDTIYGRGGNDTLAGGRGTNWLYGEDGDDLIYIGEKFNVTIDYGFGGAGDDFFSVLSNPSSYLTSPHEADGGPGADTLEFLLSDVDPGITLTDEIAYLGPLGPALVSLSNIETVHGSHLDDNMGASGSILRLLGGHGNDTLTAEPDPGRGGKPVTLIGGEGNDLLRSNTADQVILIDTDDPTETFDFPPPVHHLGDADTMIGGAGDDMIYSWSGNDVMRGGGGDDTFFTRGGKDMVEGGAGDDLVRFDFGDYSQLYAPALAPDFQRTQADLDGLVLDGGAGSDWLDFSTLRFLPPPGGGARTDGIQVSLVAASGGPLGEAGTFDATAFENVLGTVWNDDIEGNGADNWLVGDVGDDVLSGRGGDDILEGGNGDDTLEGGNGDDDLSGDAGADWLAGQAGADFLDGGAGNDSLDGGKGKDKLIGAGGMDTLIGGGGNDKLNGGAGADDLDGGAGLDRLNGGNGNDTLAGGADADNLRGGAGNDRLTGGTGDDLMKGEAGKDRLFGQAGNDVLSGGKGVDRLDGGAGDDILGGNEGNDFLRGGGGNDTLRGDQGSDVLSGALGNDLLRGGAGNDQLAGGGGGDTLEGGRGADAMSGGVGADIFVFADSQASGTADGTRDLIKDFETGVDVLDFSNLFAALSLTGSVVSAFTGTAGEVVIGAGFVSLDLDGDMLADMQIDLENGGAPVTAAAGDLIF